MELSEKYNFFLPSRDGDDIADINQISDNFRIIEKKIPSKKDLDDAVEVDQTYNPESPNAQSGVAVAEAVSGKADIPKDYELIETITLEEDIKSFSQSFEPMKKILVKISLPSGGSGNAYFNVFGADNMLRTVVYFLLNNTKNYFKQKIENGITITKAHSNADNYSQFHNYGVPFTGLTSITRISIMGNGTILAGSTFEIWGVRA